jgi:hypothetical protein
VTSNGDVFEFDWMPGFREDGVFSHWKNVTHIWGNRYRYETIAVALQMVHERSSAG